MSSYKAGTTAPDISMNVNIDTVGTAATRVSKRPTGSSGGGIAVAHSVDATGDVTNAHLGGAASLSGNTLTIATSINLFGDQDEREKEFERVSATYSLSGGDDNDKDFSPPDLKLHNSDFTRATLIKNISLTP
jgi:hypothetical protein